MEQPSFYICTDPDPLPALIAMIGPLKIGEADEPEPDTEEEDLLTNFPVSPLRPVRKDRKERIERLVRNLAARRLPASDERPIYGEVQADGTERFRLGPSRWALIPARYRGTAYPTWGHPYAGISHR